MPQNDLPDTRLALEIEAARLRHKKRVDADRIRAAKAKARQAAEESYMPNIARPSDPLRETAHRLRADGATYAAIAKAIGKSVSYVPILLSQPPLSATNRELSWRAYNLLNAVLTHCATRSEYPLNGAHRPADVSLITPALVKKYFHPPRTTGKKGWGSLYYGASGKTLLEINAWLRRHGLEPN